MPRIKSFLVVTCFLTGWLPLDYAAADHVIYQYSFSRTGSLNGKTPEAGAASWTASGSWSSDGNRATVSVPASAAFLPFKPRAGNRYTLSVRMNCTAANPVYEWMSMRKSSNATETTSSASGSIASSACPATLVGRESSIFRACGLRFCRGVPASVYRHSLVRTIPVNSASRRFGVRHGLIHGTRDPRPTTTAKLGLLTDALPRSFKGFIGLRSRHQKEVWLV